MDGDEGPLGQAVERADDGVGAVVVDERQVIAVMVDARAGEIEVAAGESDGAGDVGLVVAAADGGGIEVDIEVGPRGEGQISAGNNSRGVDAWRQRSAA